MRVLHIGKYFPPFAGGMENFCADLVAAQNRQGIATAVVVHEHGDNALADPRFANTQLTRVPTWGEVFFTPISPSFRKQFQRALAQFKPDVLHFHLPNPSAFWALTLPAARRLPWLAQWQSDVVPSPHRRALRYGYRLYRPWETSFLKHCRHIVVASPDYLRASLPLRRFHDRCRVIPLGVDPARMVTGEQDRHWGQQQWLDKGLRLLAVGRLTYYKGFRYLLQSLAELDAVQLLLVGHGRELAALQRQLSVLGLQSRARILSAVTDPQRNALLQSADALCLPSIERSEAFGIVLIEAAWFGKPVIASDISGSGVPWVVRTGQHGLLTPPADAQALTATIRQLANSTNHREALGQAGKLNFPRYFHIDSVAADIQRLYRE